MIEISVFKPLLFRDFLLTMKTNPNKLLIWEKNLGNCLSSYIFPDLPAYQFFHIMFTGVDSYVGGPVVETVTVSDWDGNSS